MGFHWQKERGARKKSRIIPFSQIVAEIDPIAAEINKRVVRDWRKRIAWERKAFLIRELGGKCIRCGQVVEQCAFDFHHLDPRTKEVQICQGINNSPDSEFTDKIVPEVLQKCVLLCANCHRITHFGQGDNKDPVA